MKKLSEDFVLNHIEEYFLMSLNALYWKGTCYSSIFSILNSYPIYSESFYKMYGNFSPLSMSTALEQIKNRTISISFLDASVLWEHFVIDIISFFRLSNSSEITLEAIITAFKKHMLCIQSVVSTALRDQWKVNRIKYAKKIFDQGNDKMFTLLEFNTLINTFSNASAFEFASLLGTNHSDSTDCSLLNTSTSSDSSADN